MNSAATLTSANGTRSWTWKSATIGRFVRARNCVPLRPIEQNFAGVLDLLDKLEEVGVERAAQALVRRDEEDPARLHLALHEEGMDGLVDPACERGQHVRARRWA